MSYLVAGPVPCSELLLCRHMRVGVNFGTMESSNNCTFVFNVIQAVGSMRCAMLQEVSQGLQLDQGDSNRLSTLIDISFELISPYMDLRPLYIADFSLSDIFWLLSGESESTLKAGRSVQATIIGLSGQAAYCTLSDMNDMEAVILCDDISSQGQVRPGDRLRQGDTVPARYVHTFVMADQV